MTLSIRNIMLKKIIFTALWISFSFLSAQEKFNVGLIGFYNLENLYDTIDQDDVNDEEFTPDGTRRYTGEIIDEISECLQHLFQSE